jgi:hypothetical protein
MTARWRSVERRPRVGPDVGGDIQAGDSWDIRFWRDDRPQSVVTVWIYPVQYQNQPGYRVQVQTEVTICTDRNRPGDTERWADAVYRDEPGEHRNLKDAGRAARALAERYAADRAHVTNWDGQSTRPMSGVR